MTYTGWFYHNPSKVAVPVAPGNWVKVVDKQGKLYEDWAENFDWSWINSGGDIARYCVRTSKGVAILKALVEAVPEKGRMDILV